MPGVTSEHYHFNVIHNRKSDIVSDFVDFITEEFLEEEYHRDNNIKLQGFIPNRDLLPGRNLFDENIRVIENSDYTIVVFDRGFLGSSWNMYLSQLSFKTLIDLDGTHRLIPISLNLEPETLEQRCRPLAAKEFIYFKNDYRHDERNKRRLLRVIRDGIKLTDDEIRPDPIMENRGPHLEAEEYDKGNIAVGSMTAEVDYSLTKDYEAFNQPEPDATRQENNFAREPQETGGGKRAAPNIPCDQNQDHHLSIFSSAGEGAWLCSCQQENYGELYECRKCQTARPGVRLEGREHSEPSSKSITTLDDKDTVNTESLREDDISFNLQQKSGGFPSGETKSTKPHDSLDGAGALPLLSPFNSVAFPDHTIGLDKGDSKKVPIQPAAVNLHGEPKEMEDPDGAINSISTIQTDVETRFQGAVAGPGNVQRKTKVTSESKNPPRMRQETHLLPQLPVMAESGNPALGQTEDDLKKPAQLLPEMTDPVLNADIQQMLNVGQRLPNTDLNSQPPLPDIYNGDTTFMQNEARVDEIHRVTRPGSNAASYSNTLEVAFHYTSINAPDALNMATPPPRTPEIESGIKGVDPVLAQFVDKRPKRSTSKQDSNPEAEDDTFIKPRLGAQVQATTEHERLSNPTEFSPDHAPDFKSDGLKEATTMDASQQIEGYEALQSEPVPQSERLFQSDDDLEHMGQGQSRSLPVTTSGEVNTEGSSDQNNGGVLQSITSGFSSLWNAFTDMSG